MFIDVHVHVFPPDVTQSIKEYTDKDNFLCQICSSPSHKYATVEELLQEMDKSGIDKAAVSGFASSDQGLCRAMNDYVLEAAANYPDRFLPMAVVSPLDPGMEKEINRTSDLGIRGVGELFPWGQNFPLEGREAGKLASFCTEKNLPLLLHVNENVGHSYPGKGDISVREASEFAVRNPELTIIFAHWGGGLPFYELMPELKKQLKNVYYDTAAGPFLYDKSIYRAAREIGILHKILLGTDYPLISPRRYLRELKESGLEPHEINMVMGENAKAIFFDPQEHIITD
ncbi:MAG: amidohydrolase family protein [Bacillota bacterium]|nr:amidohydrolase family protein [Bacillota bacterium]